ncbi:FGGY-family carbohydrate kinase [Pseudothermotoga sp. U03pept]|uniref:FGGY-family carbohydrate kinase n=1 Tax=Pseudothermotoga sp. U03pept TaxID=3447012 RepID=UPI003F10CFEC
MEKYILAIDQSTTGTKAVLFDSTLNVVKRTTEYHKQYYPKSGWVEHDPKEILDKTLTACRRVIDRIDPYSIIAVSVTNQRETAVLWDKSGKPVYNAIVWQCQRGKDLCEKLKRDGYERMVREKTGLLIDPYFSASKINWLLENVEDIRKNAENGEISFGTIDSWLIWNLCEGHPHVTDYSNASRTLLLNIHSLRWDEELLDLFNIPSKILPKLLCSDEIFGYTDLNGLLPRRLPVIGVMGDSSAALYGQMGFHPKDAKATYGTGTSMMINLGEKKAELVSGVLSIGWVTDKKITYVAEGNIHSSADTLKWVVEQLQLVNSIEELEDLAASVSDSCGVYFVPAFYGLGAPYWDSDAQALMCGMTKRTTRAHIVRAALESIAYQVYDLFSALVRETGMRPDELKADGGATKNRFLMQFQADILDLPIYVNNIEECSARGVALIAAKSIGILDEEQISMHYTKYIPNIDQQLREEYINGWRMAVKRAILH